MYADLGPGQTIDLEPPSANGVDLLYSHEYVANRMRRRPPPLSPAERTNLYAYVTNNPINRIDPSGLKQVCGFYVWVYTGLGWCVEENVYQAALDAAAEVVTCWWDCEVTTHECIAGRVLTVTETVTGVVAGLGARVPKVPGELLANQGSQGVARSFRLASRQQLKALLRPYLGRAFARSGLVAGAKGAFVVTALVEAGISIRCGYHCSR